MRRWSLSVGLVIAVGAASIMAWGQTAPHPADVQAGRMLALHDCDACHIVAAHQELPPLVPGYGPSFFDIANKPETSAESLMTFLGHQHPLGRMPSPELTPRQAADVAAYIMTLRGQH